MLVTIAFFNIPFCSNVLDEIFIDNGCYFYSNGDGTSTVACKSYKSEGKHPDHEYLSLTEVDERIAHDSLHPLIPIGLELRKVYPNADTVVYRLFKKNPLIFWRWREYIFGDEKYKFPYKDWDEIEKKRPKDFKINHEWQMF